jgi:hypothetical protein
VDLGGNQLRFRRVLLAAAGVYAFLARQEGRQRID